MRVPLRYQITEYDCATVAFTNAISYLFKRSEIEPELIKKISLFTLDTYDKDGNLGKHGTSKRAVENLSTWINKYSLNKNNIKCEYHRDGEVNLDIIKECIEKDGVVFLRTYQDCEHYVIVTDVTKKNVHIFDSYYLEKDYYNNNKHIKMVFNKPFEYNRIVDIKRFKKRGKEDFSLGPINNRECVCIFRIVGDKNEV